MIFDQIERAYVITDDRGKSTGAGIVEFQRKPAATLAVRKCSENCFFLTSSLRPVIVEMHEEVTDPEGLPEKNMFKKSGEYTKEREVGPRFANINSFEHDYGTRWKQLFELRRQKLESVEREMKLEEEKLEAQMEYAKYEHETEMLRDRKFNFYY
jgi:splicing factor, proline- and glutamine-rich